MASLSNAVGTQDTDMQELSCVLIPVHGERLLLPNVCVAEIVPWRRFKILEKGPTWCVGYVGWRGHTIPVVHFAGFGDDGEPWRQSSRCLVIMNRSRNPSAPAFYAIAAEGLPRMMQLDSEDLNNATDELGVADMMHVAVGTEMATIPNLSYIESQLSQLQQL